MKTQEQKDYDDGFNDAVNTIKNGRSDIKPGDTMPGIHKEMQGELENLYAALHKLPIQAQDRGALVAATLIVGKLYDRVGTLSKLFTQNRYASVGRVKPDGGNYYDDDDDGYWGTEGYDEYGYDPAGYDRGGYDEEGHDKNGYNKEGLDYEGRPRAR